jgi:hypothetical protein
MRFLRISIEPPRGSRDRRSPLLAKTLALDAMPAAH